VHLLTRVLVVGGLFTLAVAGLPAGGPAEGTPARFRSGPIPPLPALAVGGGEVLLEVEVSEEGVVGAITILRAAPSFIPPVTAAVKQWRFEPAKKLAQPDDPDTAPALVDADSSVLVVAVFRPPAVLGPARGEPTATVGAPTTGIPFPTVLAPPPWPPLARDGGVVLVEARVDGRGMVVTAEKLDGAPGFDDAALGTVRAWTFLPARSPDVPAESYVYAILGFPTPITGGVP
jgi:outer membrane biosynthesis protein TonB